ncbi:RuBisCO large subunit C-terminal-like domain-containing protein [Enemella sp. A6]|uniref:RuBisCO large subunit C-terminal-like domain-containing protein n=1 Tax=Enemella sp. A6 TaxID=3440152 RepID=UPI003EB98E14
MTESRLRVGYDCSAASAGAEEMARAVAVEQTIEFPPDLAPEWIRRDLVATIEEVGENSFVLSFDARLFGDSITEMLNVLWGNVSLLHGVRVTRIDLPDDFVTAMDGPRFGIAGLRRMFDAEHRPLLATALKPIGLGAADLARDAAELAAAGIDVIKDDHSLGNQVWAPWQERVARCAEAVRSSAERAGTGAVYAPSLNVGAHDVVAKAVRAAELGCGALMMLPGISGFDAIRVVARESGLPIMTHPAMLGSLTVPRDHGLPIGFVLGTLPRLAGADLSVFPNSGGRFGLTADECAEIADGCRNGEEWAPCWPTPGGGMVLDRIGGIMEQYGPDVCLLVGGDLHRGDLRMRAEAFRQAVSD